MKASKTHPPGPATDMTAMSQRNDDAQHEAATGEDASVADAARTPDGEPARPGSDEKAPKQKPGEIGGPKGPEPTRYGDWEVGGRCTDF